MGHSQCPQFGSALGSPQGGLVHMLPTTPATVSQECPRIQPVVSTHALSLLSSNPAGSQRTCP